MQLEFIWVESFRNLKNQQFNFGGKYLYSAVQKSKNSYILERHENRSHVKDFFSIGESVVENITAIVGENGAGKSNTLELIRGIFRNAYQGEYREKQIVSIEFVAVFSQKNGRIQVLKNIDSIKFLVSFKHSVIDIVPSQILTVFYSPIYDFKDSNYGDVDVSSSYLLEEDYRSQKFANEELSQSEIHRYANSSRQIDFIEEKSSYSGLREKLNIPQNVSIVLKYNNIFRSTSNFWNTPNTFRAYFEALDKKHNEEINQLTSSSHGYREKKDKANIERISKELFLSWANYYLLRNLFANIERTNRYLSHGTVKEAVESLLPLTFSEALTHFIKSQDLFPVGAILELMNELAKISKSISNFDEIGANVKSARVEVGLVKELQLAYLIYKDSIFNISGQSVPYGFMDLDWFELSSGEKAYLNFFSRLYAAKEAIYNKIRAGHGEFDLLTFPKAILILLDEGELGFHLQWQKEYVKKLIENIPAIYSPENPKIQIVFTTHSPVSLSDIPSSNIIYLTKNKEVNSFQKPRHSFGANIHDLLKDAFYFKNGYMGDFAETIIQQVINWCRNNDDRENAEYIKKTIELIDEPIIKVKLSEMFAKKMGEDTEVARLKAQRDYISNRLKELGDQ
jgi:predicted ATP-binding protein involved in virulence